MGLLSFDRSSVSTVGDRSWLITQVLPVLSLAAAAGLLAKMTSIPPAAGSTDQLAVYGLAAAAAVGIALRTSATVLARTPEHADHAWWTHLARWVGDVWVSSRRWSTRLCGGHLGWLAAGYLPSERSSERVGSVNWWSPLGAPPMVTGRIVDRWRRLPRRIGQRPSSACLRGLPQLCT